jgi:uncharacterized protein YlxW (UPF0749 family)
MTDKPSAPEPDVPEPDVPQPGSADEPRARRDSLATTIIGLLVGLLAFALVVQVRSNVGDAALQGARQDDLVRILSDLNAREQRLHGEIATLESTLGQLGAGERGRQAALAEARRRADELGILAGVLAARGEGLRIRLVPRGRATAAARVLEAVEELRGAGAEAMQIADSSGAAVRIVAATFFVDSGERIVVDGVYLAGTYTITVIGPATTMRTALTIPGGVVDSVARDGGTVIVDEPGVVTVDALHAAADLEYARPVE